MRTGRRILSRLSGSKYARLLLVLLLSEMVAGTMTIARAATPDMYLVVGSDSQCGSPPVYPCAVVYVSGTGTSATIGISFFASEVSNPQPATYYTDLLELHNGGTGNGVVDAVSVTDITGTNYLGKITVYYCTVQTDDPSDSGFCAKFDITNSTSNAGGYLSGNDVFPVSVGPGGAGYFEVVAFASATATTGDTVTFVLTVTMSGGGVSTTGGGGASATTTSSATSSVTATSTTSSTVTTTATETTTAVAATSTVVITTTSTVTTTATATATLCSTGTSYLTGTTTTSATNSSTAIAVWGLWANGILWLLLILLAVIAVFLLATRRKKQDRKNPVTPG